MTLTHPIFPAIFSQLQLRKHRTLCRGVATVHSREPAFCAGATDFSDRGVWARPWFFRSTDLSERFLYQFDLSLERFAINLHRTFCRGVIDHHTRIRAFCGGAFHILQGGDPNSIQPYPWTSTQQSQFGLTLTLNFAILAYPSTSSSLHRTFCRGVNIQETAQTTRAFCGGAKDHWNLVKLSVQAASTSTEIESTVTNRPSRHLAFLEHCQRCAIIHCPGKAFCSGANTHTILLDRHRIGLDLYSGDATETVQTPIASTFCGGVLNFHYNWRRSNNRGLGFPGHPLALTIATQCYSIVAPWIPTFPDIRQLCDLTFCGGVFQHQTPFPFDFQHWTFVHTTGVGSHITFLFTLALTSICVAAIYQTSRYRRIQTFSISNIWVHLLAFALVLLQYCSRQIHSNLQPGNIRDRNNLPSWSRPSEPSIIRHSKSSKSGPKSGRAGFHSCYLSFLAVLLTVHLMRRSSLHGGEGDGPSTGAIETPCPWEMEMIRQAGVKPCGPQPAASYGFHWLPKENAIVKRSLKRAYRRALRDGLSWYKGRCYQPKDFPVFQKAQTQHQMNSQTFPQPSVVDQQRCNSRNQTQRHLRCFHWNAGQMSLQRFDELRLWLQGQNFQVVILTETHWTYGNEWSDTHWNYIHSGNCDDAGGGILCMIDKRIQKLNELRWHEVVPGRLLHIQLRYATGCFDVLACYQHVHAKTTNQLHKRKCWLNKLDEYLDTLPKRNMLLVAGDFNSNLPCIPAHVAGRTN